MVDTVRTLAALQTLLADNVAGDISAQDVRDMLVSLAVIPQWQPAIIGAYDDYFQIDNEADWTAISADSGTETWSYPDAARYGSDRGLNVQFEDQSAQDYTAYVKPVSGIAVGDYVQTKLDLWGGEPDAGFSHAGVVLTDGTTTAANAVVALIDFNNTEEVGIALGHGTLTAMATFSMSLLVLNHTPSLHLRLTYSAANTFQFHLSLDGVNFVQMGADAAKVMTPTHGGFGASTYGASTGPSLALFRYFHSNVTP